MARKTQSPTASPIATEAAHMQAMLDAIIGNLPHFIFVKNAADLTYIRFNRAAEEFTGLKESDVVGKTNLMFIPADKLPIYEARDREALAHPERVSLSEETYKTNDGEERILQVKRIVIADNSGTARYLVGISEDITDARRTEMERDRFFTNSLDMLMISDDAGHFTRVNPAVRDVLGYTPEEFCAIPYLEMIHPDDVQGTMDQVARQMAGGTVLAFENRYRCKDGSYKWLSWRSSPLGKVMYGCARDVTIEKQAKAEIEKLNRDLEQRVDERTRELKFTAERFKRVVSSTMLGIHFWNTRGLMTEANDALLKMIGYSREDVEQGRIDWKSLTPPEYAELDKKMEAEVTRNRYCQPYEKEYICKDGSRIAVLIGAARLDDSDHEGVSYVLNISESKRIEKERNLLYLREQSAVAASQLKSEFLANMSHEIRTPINGIMGMIGLLSDSPLQSEQKEYVESAKASADTLLTVINDILDFSKVEAGKIEFEMIDFDLRKLFEDVERAFSFQTRSKGLILNFEIDPQVAQFVSGDPGRIRQVLNNLLSNAVKFTGAGTIAVRALSQVTNQGKNGVRVEICDTGVGINQAALTRMFRPFSQADASTTRRFGGTGLGLSICKHLVEAMGGTIGVESTEGEGSKFWFTLSLSSSSAPVINTIGVAGSFALTLDRPVRVLVAEDNPINQKIALKFLERMGLRVDVVGNGQEVLNALRTIPYDLVLMDCQMPELDGYEATRHIRGSRTLKHKNIPIIAMTANAMNGEKERCLEAGMDDYISKPVKAEVLYSVLSRWIVTSDGKTLTEIPPKPRKKLG